jgi:hypothetical protein
MGTEIKEGTKIERKLDLMTEALHPAVPADLDRRQIFPTHHEDAAAAFFLCGVWQKPHRMRA